MRNLKRLFLLGCSLVFLGVSGLASADIRESVEAILGMRHPSDTKATWVSLGPEAPKVLMKMYEQEAGVHRKIRLLQGLSWFGEADGASEFIKAKTVETTEGPLRRAGIEVIGKNRGEAEQGWLARFLKHPDPFARQAAAVVFKRLASVNSEAKRQYEEFLATEKVSWMRSGTAKGSGPEKVASSSEQMDPYLLGRWLGYWISPDPSSPKGLISRDAVVEFEKDPLKPQGIRGVLRVLPAVSVGPVLLKGLEEPEYRLQGVAAGTKFSWFLTHEKNGESPGEAELVRRAGVLFLELRAQAWGATLIVRKP